MRHGIGIWHRVRFSSYSVVGLYLAAIVAANVTIYYLGPSWSVVTAFVFIGFNITSRDRLHDAWHNDRLALKMMALILVGAALSAMFGAGRIAAASAIAFAASESADAIAYHLMARRGRMIRVNGSNVVSAGVDSIMFPLLAFGWPPLLAVMVGQFLAKVFGGYLWSRAIGLDPDGPPPF